MLSSVQLCFTKNLMILVLILLGFYRQKEIEISKPYFSKPFEII